ncbi:MAG TPA: phosphoglycerate mutase family protein, partial [Candidatus Binatia bacterium]|nr:phosphoglycerate mutase family protein [Candidatus Binatia bacterium]
QARYVGRLLANMDVQVDQIISSPLKRARQTATIVANELAFEGVVQIDDALRPEAGFEQFRAMLARYKKYDAIMVVGHNPSFTEFLGKSVSSTEGAAQIDFKKGAVARVEMNGRTGTLDWLVTPKIARTLQTSLKSSSRPKTSRK